VKFRGFLKTSGWNIGRRSGEFGRFGGRSQRPDAFFVVRTLKNGAETTHDAQNSASFCVVFSFKQHHIIGDRFDDFF
jgi:hypothetical protein